LERGVDVSVEMVEQAECEFYLVRREIQYFARSGFDVG
jgi:hypothetical protein